MSIFADSSKLDDVIDDDDESSVVVTLCGTNKIRFTKLESLNKNLHKTTSKTRLRYTYQEFFDGSN